MYNFQNIILRTCIVYASLLLTPAGLNVHEMHKHLLHDLSFQSESLLQMASTIGSTVQQILSPVVIFPFEAYLSNQFLIHGTNKQLWLSACIVRLIVISFPNSWGSENIYIVIKKWLLSFEESKNRIDSMWKPVILTVRIRWYFYCNKGILDEHNSINLGHSWKTFNTTFCCMKFLWKKLRSFIHNIIENVTPHHPWNLNYTAIAGMLRISKLEFVWLSPL